jgi:hypothetical protein
VNWLSIIALILQYGPGLFQALAALFTAIKEKNASHGADAVSKGADIARDVIASLDARSDMTNDQKRETAWQDIIILGRNIGLKLTESQARTLAELALQGYKSENVPSDQARTIGMNKGDK